MHQRPLLKRGSVRSHLFVLQRYRLLYGSVKIRIDVNVDGVRVLDVTAARVEFEAVANRPAWTQF